ncbi:hypothetical protein LJC46_04355 [Desulfovibrio sp. OttesenSCG-928-G15]|nr:hypothetical protein [Desulfovibrio sp. OttesenSCG-928-G15]
MGGFALPIMMGGASVLSGGMQMSAIDQGTAAQVSAAKYNSAEMERQATISDMQGVDAIERGEAERLKYMRGAQQDMGSTAARMGASGIAVDSGSALDVLSDSAAESALDAATIRHNAKNEAWTYGEQARDYRNQAMMQRNSARDAIAAGKIQKSRTLLNTAGSLAMAGLAAGWGSGESSTTAAKAESSGIFGVDRGVSSAWSPKNRYAWLPNGGLG